jgi:hypothetical protein
MFPAGFAPVPGWLTPVPGWLTPISLMASHPQDSDNTAAAELGQHLLCTKVSAGLEQSSLAQCCQSPAAPQNRLMGVSQPE